MLIGSASPCHFHADPTVFHLEISEIELGHFRKVLSKGVDRTSSRRLVALLPLYILSLYIFTMAASITNTSQHSTVVSDSKLVYVLNAQKMRKKLTIFSWCCRVAQIVPFTVALYEHISTVVPLTLSRIKEEHKRENLETLADAVEDNSNTDKGFFYALWLTPSCQGHSVDSQWPLIEEIRKEKGIQIPKPKPETWEANLSFLAAKFPDFAHLFITPQAEAGAEGDPETGAQSAPKKKRARQQQQPTKEAAAESNKGACLPMGECTCNAAWLIKRSMVDQERLEKLDELANNIIIQDTNKCALDEKELKPLRKQLDSLKKHLVKGSEDDKVLEMQLDTMVAISDPSEEVTKLMSEFESKKGEMVSAVLSEVRQREALDELNVKVKEQLEGAEKEQKEAAKALKEARLTAFDKEAFSQKLEYMAQKWKTFTLRKLDHVQKSINHGQIELSIKKEEDALRDLQDKSLQAKGDLMKVVGELHVAVPSRREEPTLPEDLNDAHMSEALPQSVPELQNMVKALQANLDKEKALREEEVAKLTEKNDELRSRVKKIKLKLSSLKQVDPKQPSSEHEEGSDQLKEKKVKKKKAT